MSGRKVSGAAVVSTARVPACAGARSRRGRGEIEARSRVCMICIYMYTYAYGHAAGPLLSPRRPPTTTWESPPPSHLVRVRVWVRVWVRVRVRVLDKGWSQG